MEVIKRNTDYALRAMVSLAAGRRSGPASTRRLAGRAGIPYPLACKIMQRLKKAGLTNSSMGPKGGFVLAKSPSKISILAIIETMQGSLRLNKCLLGANGCPKRPRCPVSGKLVKLQNHIERYLGGISLEEVTRGRQAVRHSRQGRRPGGRS
jgi:Rrf2 family protein